MNPIAGKTSAELRAAYMSQRFAPAAAGMFAASPAIKAIVYAVAQFWADEADDAVHERMVLSLDEDPSWPACLQSPIYGPYGTLAEPYRSEWKAAGLGPDGVDRKSGKVAYFDENQSAITAFASCCTEGCDQEMDVAEAFTPYAIANRDGKGGVTIRIVGKLLRPEWEDRFHVGFNVDGEYDEEEEPA